MEFDEALKIANQALFKSTGRHLNDLQVKIFRMSWEEKTYEQMAEQLGYHLGHIQQTGANLWKQLSEAVKEEVSKKNFREALKRWSEKHPNPQPPEPNPQPPEPIPDPVPPEPPFPGGAMPLDDSFYLERPPIEAECYKAIMRPQALIRIKGPKQRGKTSLLNRILQNAAERGYRTVHLDLDLADFTNLDKFLQWFCVNNSLELGITPILDDYWDQNILDCITCCKTHFQKKLLEPLDCPLALGLDNVDRVFEYPDIAREFFALLRSWHDGAGHQGVWQRLRLAIAHSTEVYIRLDVNQSPFNVGLPVELPEFTRAQVQNLARLYGLDWVGDEEIRCLMAIVGGHPSLIQLGFYRLWHQDVSLDKLLREAPTQAGIYSAHLRCLLGDLQKQRELAAAMKKVVTADTSVPLEPMQTFKLESMGLVQKRENECTPSCELYRQYFRSHL